MTLKAGLRGESRATRAVGAACSVAVVALVAGCDSGSTQVRVENHCDVPIQASYSTLVLGASQDPDIPPASVYEVAADAATDVAAGASSTLKLDGNGDGWLVIRGNDGEWLTVAPLDTEAPPGSDGGFIKDGVFVVDGVLCAQLDG